MREGYEPADVKPDFTSEDSTTEEDMRSGSGGSGAGKGNAAYGESEEENVWADDATRR